MEGDTEIEDNLERIKSRSGQDYKEKPLLVKNSIMNNTSQLAIIGANVCSIESLDYE